MLLRSSKMSQRVGGAPLSSLVLEPQGTTFNPRSLTQAITRDTSSPRTGRTTTPGTTPRTASPGPASEAGTPVSSFTISACKVSSTALSLYEGYQSPDND